MILCTRRPPAREQSQLQLARAVLGALAVLLLAVAPLHAQGLTGTQRQGTLAPIPIAIPYFLGTDPQLSADIADVVAADLERSGLFDSLDRASFLEQVRDVNAPPRFPDWRAIRADALVVGTVRPSDDGRLVSEFRLWDVATGKQLAGQRFATGAKNWRRIGHIIADQVYERLTGEKGYFDTRVVFVDESGPKDRRVKRLAIMDQEGNRLLYTFDAADPPLLDLGGRCIIKKKNETHLHLPPIPCSRIPPVPHTLSPTLHHTSHQ